MRECQQPEPLITTGTSKDIREYQAFSIRKTEEAHTRQNWHNVLKEQFPDSDKAKDDPENIELLSHLTLITI